MAFIQRMLLVASVAAVASAAPQRSNNEYLPPDKGYDYPKPQVPFTPTSPPYRPPQNNPPTYAPPQNTPPPYRPPQTNPPVYTPPQVTPPPYRPPQNTPPPYRPPQTNPPVYKPPQPTVPAYRPPQPTPPPYRPPQNIPPTYGPPPTSPPYNPRPQPPQIIRDEPNPNGDGSHNHEHGHGHDHVHEAGMPYDFNYAVKDDYYGTDFSQNEASDGDNVKGEYRVQLPDGRLQIVTYTADWKTGFHAVVTYQGEAKYPEQKPYVPQASNTNVNQADAGYNYQPPATPVKPSNQYGAPNY